MTTLDTPRLRLRTWTMDDFAPFAEMLADPEVMRFLGVDGKPLTRFGAWQAFSGQVGHWQLRGFGMFAVVERSTGEFIGRVGPWQPEEWPGFEIGWTLRSKFWGRGYATEAAAQCIRYAFRTLDRPRIISLIDPENVRSIRVAERLGERLECETALPHWPADRPVLQYGLTRDDWQSLPTLDDDQH